MERLIFDKFMIFGVRPQIIVKYVLAMLAGCARGAYSLARLTYNGNEWYPTVATVECGHIAKRWVVLRDEFPCRVAGAPTLLSSFPSLCSIGLASLGNDPCWQGLVR